MRGRPMLASPTGTATRCRTARPIAVVAAVAGAIPPRRRQAGQERARHQEGHGRLGGWRIPKTTTAAGVEGFRKVSLKNNLPGCHLLYVQGLLASDRMI